MPGICKTLQLGRCLKHLEKRSATGNEAFSLNDVNRGRSQSRSSRSSRKGLNGLAVSATSRETREPENPCCTWCFVIHLWFIYDSWPQFQHISTIPWVSDLPAVLITYLRCCVTLCKCKTLQHVATYSNISNEFHGHIPEAIFVSLVLLVLPSLGMPTLHDLLEASAQRRPDHVCLQHDETSMTYDEVWKAVERCASHLVLLDDPVLALVADRSCGLVISLLGVLRAGKAYTPIEPDFPASRAQAMMETADIKHVLVPVDQLPQPILHQNPRTVLAVHNNGLVCTSAGHPTPSANELPDVSDRATAYVLLTSGSTGKPKGCCVPHRGSALYAQAVVEHCTLHEDMVFLLKTPYVFDVSIQDLFTAFCAGGTLQIANPGAVLSCAFPFGDRLTEFDRSFMIFLFINFIFSFHDISRLSEALTKMLVPLSRRSPAKVWIALASSRRCWWSSSTTWNGTQMRQRRCLRASGEAFRSQWLERKQKENRKTSGQDQSHDFQTCGRYSWFNYNLMTLMYMQILLF